MAIGPDVGSFFRAGKKVYLGDSFFTFLMYLADDLVKFAMGNAFKEGVLPRFAVTDVRCAMPLVHQFVELMKQFVL